MAPKVPFPSLAHRLRTAHPLGPAMRRTLHQMDHASAEEVRRFQDARLRRLVAWAARRSPYYRDFFATSGVAPSDIRTQDDLHLLPVLDRHDLTDRAERFCAYPKRLMWPSRSSGTSGQVVTVYRTPGSSVYELAALERQWGWFGLGSGSRRIVTRAAGAGLGVTDSTDLAQEVPGAHQLLVSAYVLGRADPEAMLQRLRAFGPDAVEGWPSSIALIAAMLERRGETLPVTAVITSSEVMTTHQVDSLRRAFEAPVVDHYGQTERVAMAGSCEHGGYHLFPDYGITELVPVPGEDGQLEVVGTPLHNWGFPIFRYRTGDTVSPPPEGDCPCGRAFPRIGAIGGRVEDTFTSAEGLPLPLPGTVVDDIVGVEEAQIAQLGAGRFEARVVVRPGHSLDDVRRQVVHNVETYFGPGQDLTFAVLDRIPRSASGKLRPAVLDPDGR